MTGVTRTATADQSGILLAIAGPACTKMTGRGGRLAAVATVAMPASAGPLRPPMA
jgi:hypothetical protein